MTDERSNEEIARDYLWPFESVMNVKAEARGIVAALAAAGRLVTPEHDAQVLRDAAVDWHEPNDTSTYPASDWLFSRADAVAKGGEQ